MNRREFIKSLGVISMGSVIPFNVKSDIDNKTTIQLSELKEIYSIIFNLYKENYIPTDNIKYNRLSSYKIINIFCDYIVNVLKPKYKSDTEYLTWNCVYNNECNETFVLIINNPKLTICSKSSWSDSVKENDYKNIPSKSLKYNGIVTKFNHFNHTLITYRIELNNIPELNYWWDLNPIKLNKLNSYESILQHNCI